MGRAAAALIIIAVLMIGLAFMVASPAWSARIGRDSPPVSNAPTSTTVPSTPTVTPTSVPTTPPNNNYVPPTPIYPRIKGGELVLKAVKPDGSVINKWVLQLRMSVAGGEEELGGFSGKVKVLVDNPQWRPYSFEIDVVFHCAPALNALVLLPTPPGGGGGGGSSPSPSPTTTPPPGGEDNREPKDIVIQVFGSGNLRELDHDFTLMYGRLVSELGDGAWEIKVYVKVTITDERGVQHTAYSDAISVGVVIRDGKVFLKG